MKIAKLYADLQINPRNNEVYRQIIEYYKNINFENEAKAFEILIQKKFNDNSSNSDKK